MPILTDSIRNLLYKAMQEIPAKERLQLFMEMIDQLSPLERKALEAHLQPKHKPIAKTQASIQKSEPTPLRSQVAPLQPKRSEPLASESPVSQEQMRETVAPAEAQMKVAAEFKKMTAQSLGVQKGKMRKELYSCIALVILSLIILAGLGFLGGSFWNWLVT